MSIKNVVFVGNARTYKTTIAKAIVGETSIQICPNCAVALPQMYNNYSPTVDTESYIYHGLSGIQYRILDCAGHIDYASSRKNNYIGADIVIVFTGGQEANNSAHYGNRSQDTWMEEVKQMAYGAIVHLVYNPSINTIKDIMR